MTCGTNRFAKTSIGMVGEKIDIYASTFSLMGVYNESGGIFPPLGDFSWSRVLMNANVAYLK